MFREICERVAFGAFCILAGVIVVALIIATAHASPPPPVLKIAVLVDTSVNADPMPDALRAAQLLSAQLGLSVQVNQVARNHVADDTQPLFLLPKVPVDKASDVTIFLTDRALNVGAQALRGSAIPFSAYTDAGVAVVSLTDDGFDYEVIAHEIGHTLGAPHDDTDACKGRSPAAGYIMQAYAVSGSGTFSDCSRSEISSYLATRGVVAAPVSTPPPPVKNSGGGSFDEVMLGFMFGIAFCAYATRRR